MDNVYEENTLKDLRCEFFNHVLNWDPNWFWGKKNQNNIPDVINNIKMTVGQPYYNDVKEYQSVMFPQLIHEYWFALQKDYEAFFKEKSSKQIEVKKRDKRPLLNELVLNQKDDENSYRYVSYSTKKYCCVKNKQDCIHPRRGDLAELTAGGTKCFAYVTDKIVSGIKTGFYTICYKLLLSTSSKISENLQGCLLTITSITFLEGCLGMVDALNDLGTFPLCKLILSPNAEQYRMPSKLKLQLSDIPTNAHPNPSQLRVISGLIEAIELSDPKICLVQGPPGTGKSNTIVNLIASMIKRDNDIQFLVCAASNKAVDSLAIQLMKIQPILENQSIPFQVIRIGNEEKVDEAVQDILLQNFTRAEGKEDVLKNSQVITSTLVSCYTNNCMRQVFGYAGPFSRRLVCIVDEAAQANELLTMIPLLLGVKLLFLVGDHQQLEPIVLSQEAKRYGFDSSLFSRAQRIFKYAKINPIAMLDTQYRMVRSISSWPNKYFYNGRLKDAATVNPLGICNYMLFNHHFPQNPNGRANIKEAELVGKLIMFLKRKLNLKESGKITIGVITPYHEQRELIKNLLHQEENKFPKDLETSKRQIQTSDGQLFPKYRNNCEKENEKTTIINRNIHVQELTKGNETPTVPFIIFVIIKNILFFILSLFLPFTSEENAHKKINKTIAPSTKFFQNSQLDCGNNDDENDLMLNVGLEVENNKHIEVNTVDSFQGSERDIIIMSCVRSHKLGFTNNPNRLNVSLTRAKHTLIMLGNFRAFAENSMWSNMIQDAKKRNVLVQVNDSNAESVFNKHVSEPWTFEKIHGFKNHQNKIIN